MLTDFEEEANRLDEVDPLKEFRQEFHFPKYEGNHQDCVYLCGNSLGLQPKGVQKYVLNQLDKWALQGVEGHFTEPMQWLTIDETVKESMARLVGALPSEVVLMNSLTANLHFMMSSFYRPTETRHKILIEMKAFPSDIHAVTSQILFHNLAPSESLLELAPRSGDEIILIEDIMSMLDREGESIALVLLGGVQYFTGQFFDLKEITKKAHQAGCLAAFDLAHAVGNVPLQLHDWGVDFACWCTYKYLNCGPGSIGGCFVHEKHTMYSSTYSELESTSSSTSSTTPTAETCAEFYGFSPKSQGVVENKPVASRLAGWWGHRLKDRFMMGGNFIPESGVNGFRVSNPPVLLIACVRASLDLFDKAGMDRIRAKSMQLTGLLERMITCLLPADDVRIFTPADPHRRGCQLSLSFNGFDPDTISSRLKTKGVICDARKPNVMRVAPAPLYNSFGDVVKFVKILKEELELLRNEC